MTPFGWRFAGALIGTLSVLIFARVARRMTRSTLLGCAAGLLLALDGMHLVTSRTAILDIFVMFWVLAGFALPGPRPRRLTRRAGPRGRRDRRRERLRPVRHALVAHRGRAVPRHGRRHQVDRHLLHRRLRRDGRHLGHRRAPRRRASASPYAGAALLEAVPGVPRPRRAERRDVPHLVERLDLQHGRLGTRQRRRQPDRRVRGRRCRGCGSTTSRCGTSTPRSRSSTTTSPGRGTG